jgi:hypothetical protein
MSFKQRLHVTVLGCFTDEITQEDHRLPGMPQTVPFFLP